MRISDVVNIKEENIDDPSSNADAIVFSAEGIIPLVDNVAINGDVFGAATVVAVDDAVVVADIGVGAANAGANDTSAADAVVVAGDANVVAVDNAVVVADVGVGGANAGAYATSVADVISPVF